jgi:hypothetical protein
MNIIRKGFLLIGVNDGLSRVPACLYKSQNCAPQHKKDSKQSEILTTMA